MAAGWSQGRCLGRGRKRFFFLPQAWERLEKAEHERELALRNELIRQEKLEQLARRFDRKAAMRETWLSENQRLVSQVGEIARGSSRNVGRTQGRRVLLVSTRV